MGSRHNWIIIYDSWQASQSQLLWFLFIVSKCFSCRLCNEPINILPCHIFLLCDINFIFELYNFSCIFLYHISSNNCPLGIKFHFMYFLEFNKNSNASYNRPTSIHSISFFFFSLFANPFSMHGSSFTLFKFRKSKIHDHFKNPWSLLILLSQILGCFTLPWILYSLPLMSFFTIMIVKLGAYVGIVLLIHQETFSHIHQHIRAQTHTYTHHHLSIAHSL